MTEDSRLKDSVIAELKWEPSVDEAHIGVTAKDGVVSLIGHVENYAQKHGAEIAAGRVQGVLAVAEELDVRLPFDATRGDEEIAAAAIERLSWNITIPRDSIKVKVESGWVTLSGQVEWNYQKNAAHDDIRWLTGVVGVTNQVTIKARVNALDISDKIMHALHRSWFSDPKSISVTTNGGAVKLTGTVHSWRDRNVATATAWSAPGATTVENDITIV